MLKERMPKDDKWFANIKWEQSCLECQAKTNGHCADRECAANTYDPWGDVLPDYLICPDCDSTEDYLEEKWERLYHNDFRIALERNYLTRKGMLSASQIDNDLFFAWLGHIKSLSKICARICENHDWANTYEMNFLVESTELHEQLQQLLDFVGKVNGYPLRRDENMARLIVAYAFDCSTLKSVYPSQSSEKQERCHIDITKFRSYIEKYIARQIINQKAKTEKILADEEHDLMLAKNMSMDRRKRIKQKATNSLDRTSHTTIEFTTFVVLCDVFSCNKRHTIEPIRAVVNIVAPNGVIRQEEVSAGYCKHCNIYFLLETDYTRIKSKGLLLCQLISKDKYNSKMYIEDDGSELRPESILHRSGYNVNAIDALTAAQRQKILKCVLDNGLYSVSGLLSFLDWLIRRSSHTKSRNMSNALQKWKADRDFVTNYKSDVHRRVNVDIIKR